MNAIFIVIPAWIVCEYVYQDIIKHKAFQEAKNLTKHKGILNLGSGASRSLTARQIAFSPFVKVNVDINNQERWETPNFLCWNLRYKLPFTNKKFDVCFASHTIEHLKDPHFVIKEALRVADKVILVFPPIWGLTNWLNPDHKKIWLLKEIKNLEKKYPRIKVFY